MSNVERTTSWQRIQQGLREAEQLISRKEYNLVMVKARQTLEIMVRCQAEKACLVEGDLSDTIDQLYEGRWIDRATKDNYHTIRILGNKAVHEGDDTAYDANQAYQLLNQEVFAFANESAGSRAGAASRTVPRASSRLPADRQAPSGRQTSSAGRSSRSARSGRSAYGAASRSGTARRRKKRRTSPMFYVWRLLIPVLIVILLIVIIRMLLPGGGETDVTTSAPIVTEASTPPPTQPTIAETEPETETEPAAETWVVNGNSVNVRSEPSTDSRILVQLSDGTVVDYVKRYSNDWSVINYDGQEAYISSQYLERVEETAQDAGAEGEAAPEEAQE